MSACPSCGTPLPTDAAFCPECGARAAPAPFAAPAPSAAPSRAARPKKRSLPTWVSFAISAAAILLVGGGALGAYFALSHPVEAVVVSDRGAVFGPLPEALDTLTTADVLHVVTRLDARAWHVGKEVRVELWRDGALVHTDALPVASPGVDTVLYTRELGAFALGAYEVRVTYDGRLLETRRFDLVAADGRPREQAPAKPPAAADLVGRYRCLKSVDAANVESPCGPQRHLLEMRAGGQWAYGPLQGAYVVETVEGHAMITLATDQAPHEPFAVGTAQVEPFAKVLGLQLAGTEGETTLFRTLGAEDAALAARVAGEYRCRAPCAHDDPWETLTVETSGVWSFGGSLGDWENEEGKLFFWGAVDGPAGWGLATPGAGTLTFPDVGTTWDRVGGTQSAPAPTTPAPSPPQPEGPGPYAAYAGLYYCALAYTWNGTQTYCDERLSLYTLDEQGGWEFVDDDAGVSSWGTYDVDAAGRIVFDYATSSGYAGPMWWGSAAGFEGGVLRFENSRGERQEWYPVFAPDAAQLDALVGSWRCASMDAADGGTVACDSDWRIHVWEDGRWGVAPEAGANAVNAGRVHLDADEWILFATGVAAWDGPPTWGMAVLTTDVDGAAALYFFHNGTGRTFVRS